ncbi:MAG: lytic transglycosylase domain-containing protein [Gemmatimonadetes bacterium]|nr:lytic transglycosylase domain-containing protein [Gemmatimonadota bacterium]
MENDRKQPADGMNEPQARDGAGRHGESGGQSAPQRRGEGTDAATRQYQDELRKLDSAGTVDEAHDRKAGGSDRGHQASGANPDEPRGGGADLDPSEARERGSITGLIRDNAMTIGLAASSLALLAGTRGGADEKPASVAIAEGFMPPAEVAEKKGVSWDLHVSDHDRVDFFTEFLMGKNYDKTRTWLERIGKYGPMIQNELRERGMPEDLLYLTMIESGLDPNAYSKAHAAGLWQFIQETGERYGLEVSTYVDDRRDPVKATPAALTYLQEMHERFDSWYLSAAGYNTGENRVGRLMRETTGTEKGTDEGYWSIWERLPAETRDYVPLMLAMGHIAKEPAKYGFHDLEYQQPLTFEEVLLPGGTQLSAVAAAAGVDSDVVYDLNPHLVKKQTPPNREMAVRVPVGQSKQVAGAFGAQVVNTGALAD